MKDHRKAVVCDFQNKATVDQTVGGLQTTVTQTSQMKILHSLKKQRHLLSQTVVLLPIQWKGFSVLAASGSTTMCPFITRFAVSSSTVVAAVLMSDLLYIQVGLEGQPRFLYDYIYKKKHCSYNLHGYWDNFTALTTFNKQSIRHSFTVRTRLNGIRWQLGNCDCQVYVIQVIMLILQDTTWQPIRRSVRRPCTEGETHTLPSYQPLLQMFPMTVAASGLLSELTEASTAIVLIDRRKYQ